MVGFHTTFVHRDVSLYLKDCYISKYLISLSVSSSLSVFLNQYLSPSLSFPAYFSLSLTVSCVEPSPLYP